MRIIIKKTIRLNGVTNMITIKKKALDVISKLPDSASIDDIMYQLYVLDKIRKGQEAVKDGKTISVEELKKEMKSW